MKASTSWNRREFLRTTTTVVAGAAILGPGEGASMAAFTQQPLSGLIDVNVSLGRWPTRRLPFDDTRGLVAKLRKQSVTQAWAGNFTAAFGTDLSAANTWLARECAQRGRGVLVPFGTVNPVLAGWETELRRCRVEQRMPGLRLYPNYHGYKLGDPAFAALLSLADEQGLIVQIAASLEDERTQPVTAQVPHVDVKPLLALLKGLPNARVMLLNWSRALKPDEVRGLAELGVHFDIATLENVGGVANLSTQISPDRIVFGSHAPFFYFESAQFKLTESALDPAILSAVCRTNARRLLG